MHSAPKVKDLKDAETKLKLADPFKYPMVSIPSIYDSVQIESYLSGVMHECRLTPRVHCKTKRIHNGCSMQIENSFTRDNCSASIGKPLDAEQLPS